MSVKKILIADDDDEMRVEISDVLKGEGYEVKTVADGKSVLRMIKKENFDILLLDLKMHGMTGFEVLLKLSAQKLKMKVIVLTGSILNSSLPDEKSITHSERTRVLKLADLVISKPFDTVKLIAKIKDYSER